NPELAVIPVIVMTQSDSEEDEVNALSHGATDFVPKPYRPQIILHRVASIINLRETASMANQYKYDQLTGLYSKGFFCQRVRELLQQNPEQEYDIICTNIEKFKLFNDAFGAAAGDRLLCEIAEILRERAGEDGICSRHNGDKFLCLCQRGREYKDELFLSVNEEINRLPNAKNLVLKWGVYQIRDRSLPAEHMCDRVLLAADSIKGKYHKCFAVYDDALRDKLLREQAIVDSMESALQEGQFTVFLQPKYRLENEELAGAEALVRWNHPERGFISPGEFIPVFEKNGFITKMDYFVWEQVCALLGEWQKKGYPPLPVSVNVSRADFYQSDLVSVLQNLVEKYGISPKELHLEVTESAYTEDPRQILHTVEELRKQGFLIEMDDFGSGYSSLNMLNQMALDIVKLDMKFIQNQTEKPMNRDILRFIVDLAHWLNLSVVAEGIETKEQMLRLKELGCDYAQGYFFAKPMPVPAFEKMLQEL
ncbi:MAG: EAL domain-containing protein, partial [Anaerotignum sp.]